MESGWETGPHHRLSSVLRDGAGSCVGRTLLYLAVAERLELPLHAVEAPGHVFVRWDDGKVLRNVEVTDRGAEHPDSWYVEAHSIDPRDVEVGVFLANVSKRRVLSMLLSNQSVQWRTSPYPGGAERHEIAFRMADRAARLDPRNASAVGNRAHARLSRPSSDVEAALEDARAAVAMRPRRAEYRALAGDLFLRLGRTEEARVEYEEALALAPGDTGIELGRARALLEAERFAGAREQAEAVLARQPEHATARWLRLVALVRLRDEAWPEELRSLAPAPRGRPDVRLAVAELLLRPEIGAGPDAAAALAVLDEIVEPAEADEFLGGALRESGDSVTLVTGGAARDSRLRHHDLRARALEALGRLDEARSHREKADQLRETEEGR
jgi:tetratricopeptide (TPR) repeat protein